MRQTYTGCYGCKYNYNGQCVKDGACTGVIPYETYASTASVPNYIPSNTPIMTEQEIKKEAILQMICVFRNFDNGIKKDLDDDCEDIYNEVFVPLLEKARKETAKEFAQKLVEKINAMRVADDENYLFRMGFDTLKEHLVELISELLRQLGVEVGND